jgi:PAP2 superfamily
MTSRTMQANHTEDSQTLRVGLTWPRQRFLVEAITVIGGYVLYELVRAWAPTNPIPAFRHAARIIHLEKITHIDIELPLNRVFSTHALLGSFSGYWYAILHFLVTPLVLLWLWRWRPTVFPRLRSTLVLMSIVSLAVFWLFPVAPPRFVVPGMTDILVQRNVVDSGPAHGISGFVDLYAAVPSLHVAWAAWCALAVVCAYQGPWRHVAWLYPAMTTFVVLGTANHYVLDAVAGIALLAAAWWVTGDRAIPFRRRKPPGAESADQKAGGSSRRRAWLAR